MEQFDAEKARRVWKRVQGEAEQQGWSFSDFISIKTQTSAMYQRLSRYYRGHTGAVLQNFYRQEQAHIATVSELFRLCTGQTPETYTPLPRKEPVTNLLEQCYGLKLQLLRLYDKYANTQYGSIFQNMIAQEQAQCRFLLKLLQK